MRHVNAASSLAACALLAVANAYAAPVKYEIDPKHTHPSFEADHFGGMSVWRGKFNKTTGSIVLDRDAKTGTVDVVIDMASVDTGLDELNDHLKKADYFEVEKYPTATYRGKFSAFVDGKPTEVDGELTLRGVTRPLKLEIKSFKCMPHPMFKHEFCGADAAASFNRDEFGIDWGKNFGFDMWVRLQIQVEANVAK